MKSRVSFSENSINVKTPILMLFTVSSIGAIALATGVYFLHDIPVTDHLLIGFGVVFLFTGLFLLFNSKYYKIVINEEPGYLSLVESTGWDISPLKIPFKYFNEIVIQYLINRDKPEYEIMLKNRYGSLMLVARIYDEAKALSFSSKFEKTMGLKVTMNSEIPSDLVDRRHPFSPYTIVIPDNSSIKITEKRDSSELIWKLKYNPIQIAFMFCIYYGFFHIIHFAAVPSSGINPLSAGIVYTFLGILLSILITFILSILTGTYHLITGKESVIYFHKIFGRKYGEMEMKKTDIALVRSSIDLGTEEILLVSRSGINSLNNLIKKFSTGGANFKNMIDISDLKAFKDEMMRLNVSNMKLAEKLYIEQFIMKNL